MEKQALGMVETKGLVGSIEAADAMVKAATSARSRLLLKRAARLPSAWASWSACMSFRVRMRMSKLFCPSCKQ